MKKIIILCFVLLPVISSAQYIKISGGAAFSNMYAKKYDFKTDIQTGFNAKLGIDYWEHKYFYLSGEIGYLAISDNEIVYRNEYGEKLYSARMIIDNLHVNTTFRGKLNLSDKFYVFAGLGPKLDYAWQFRLTDKESTKLDHDKKILPGFKADAGFFYDINRWRFYAEYAYLHNFTKVIDVTKSRSHLVNFAIGYKLFQ